MENCIENLLRAASFNPIQEEYTNIQDGWEEHGFESEQEFQDKYPGMELWVDFDYSCDIATDGKVAYLITTDENGVTLSTKYNSVGEAIEAYNNLDY